MAIDLWPSTACKHSVLGQESLFEVDEAAEMGGEGHNV